MRAGTSTAATSGRPAPASPGPRVTIVTAVRNRAATLARTIESVLAQSYPEVEHIVIDGASQRRHGRGHPALRRPAGVLGQRAGPRHQRGVQQGRCGGARRLHRPAQCRRLAGAGADRARGRGTRAERRRFRVRRSDLSRPGRAPAAPDPRRSALRPRDRPRHAGRQPSDAAGAARGLRAGRRLRSGAALRDGLRLAAARPSRGLSRDLRAGGRRPHDARRRVRSRLPAGARRGARHRDRSRRAGRAGLAALSLSRRQGHRAARAAAVGAGRALRGPPAAGSIPATSPIARAAGVDRAGDRRRRPAGLRPPARAPALRAGGRRRGQDPARHSALPQLRRCCCSACSRWSSCRRCPACSSG